MDGGVNWRPIFDDQPVQSIGSLAVAPSDPNVVWAGTGEGKIRSHISLGQGVYKSIDAGETLDAHGPRAAPGAFRDSWSIRRTPTSCSSAPSATPTDRSRSAASIRTTDGGVDVDTRALRGREHRLLRPRHGPDEPAHALRRHVAARDPHVGAHERRPGQRALRLARRRRHLDAPRGERASHASRWARWRWPSPRPTPQRVYAMIETGDGIPWEGASHRERPAVALGRRRTPLDADQPRPQRDGTRALLLAHGRRPRRRRTRRTS